MGRSASMGSAWPGRMAAPRRGNRARRRRACSQPRATPWVAGGFPSAPRRGKSHGSCASVTAFTPFGGVSAALLPTRGDASFGRSTPGWELATPSGFCLERWSSKNRAGQGACNPFWGARRWAGCLDGKRLAGPYGCAPKGQPGSPKAGLLPAQGNALGCGWFSKRAPKGQKPWELRFCHCFYPLWGRVCRASAYPG